MTKRQQSTRQATVDVASLQDAPWNPRAAMDGTRLVELVHSIKDCGVLVPIVVRVTDGGAFEVVCGHRRVEACRQLGLTEVQAVIHEDLDDDAARLIALVENVQREDLTAMDEAVAYRAMIDAGMSIDEVAGKASRSKSAVYQRLKLLDLSPQMQAAVGAGQVSISAAAMIASIPDDEMRAEAERTTFDELDYSEVATGAFVRELIEREFSANLERAPFDTADATLHESRGPCGECPHRTGNQADLFGGAHTGESPDMCTDPGCFRVKSQVSAQRKLAKHAAKGIETLDPDTAPDVFSHGTDRLKGSKYVKASEKCYEDPEQRTFKALLKGSGVEPVAAADERGKVHLLYPRSAVKKVLTDVHGIGILKSASAGVSAKGERRRKEMNRIAVDAIMLAIRNAVMVLDGDLPEGAWQMLAKRAAERGHAAYGTEQRMIARHAMTARGVDNEDSFEPYVDRATNASARALLVEILLDPVVHEMVDTRYTDGGEVLEIERVFGLNLVQIEQAAVAAAEAQEVSVAAEAKARKTAGKRKQKD